MSCRTRQWFMGRASSSSSPATSIIRCSTRRASRWCTCCSKFCPRISTARRSSRFDIISRCVWPLASAARTLRQLLLLDGEDGAGLDLNVAHDALAAAHVGELDIVAAGLDAGDAQALVVIDLAVAVILALVGAPFVLAGRRQVKLLHG